MSKQHKPQYLLIFCVLAIQEILGTCQTASECSPRFAHTVQDNPFFWNIFGKSKKKGSGGSSKDIDEGSREIDENSPKYEKLKWTTSDWIEKNNFSLEVHYVATEDGYNLTLHRMPRPGSNPVLLVHGLLTSSLAWVVMGPTKSLAFQLFNNEHDVWLANLRGSPYGRNHTRFSIKDGDFWSFSYHEWGRYDLPAIVDHIRNETSFHQVWLIVHSQAFNALLVMCSLLPQYNERVQFVQALAPIASLRNQVKFTNDDVRKVFKFVKKKTSANDYELLPKNFMRDKCLKSSQRTECEKWFTLLAGNGQYERTMNTLLYGQLLQGGSIKEATHLRQLWKSGDFVWYDYEPQGNLLHYGTVEPTSYNLSQVRVPMILYFGDTDAIATPEGVHSIYAHMLEGVKGVYRILADKFNHYDFYISSDVKKLVNDRLLEHKEKTLKNQLKYVIE
uniref:Partial AB-hydrolase lipase domain-containing protein n=1 Tax=Stomoxys calcitrans TaxID=35570 RepID=A0A1I8NWV0_STOCA